MHLFKNNNYIIKNAISNRHLKKIGILLRRLKNRLHPIRGKRNWIQNFGVSIGIRYDICGNYNRIIIGRGTVVSKTKIFMRGNYHLLEIGENCHCEGGSFYFEDEKCIIRLGKSVTLANAHLAVTEPGRQILIGNDCKFGNGLEIRTGDSHSIISIATGKRINFAKDVLIHDHVWVGAHVKILKGSIIMDGSVIGTGSIVSGRIGSNCIASGDAAKSIMSNVTWKVDRVYKEADQG